MIIDFNAIFKKFTKIRVNFLLRIDEYLNCNVIFYLILWR